MITKCKGTDCPIRMWCYRFTSMPEKLNQKYLEVVPKIVDGDCDEYWENQCPYCNEYNGIHKFDCATNKITVIL